MPKLPSEPLIAEVQVAGGEADSQIDGVLFLSVFADSLQREDAALERFKVVSLPLERLIKAGQGITELAGGKLSLAEERPVAGKFTELACELFAKLQGIGGIF